MSRTLKEILDDVSLESGMDTEAIYAESTVDAVKRLVSFANAARRVQVLKPWQALRKVYEFTLSSDTVYDLPSDYSHFVPDTMYSDSHLWATNFPTGSDTWSYLQASTGGSGIREKCRLIANKLEFYQPNSGNTMRVEYGTKKAVVTNDAESTKKERFTADDDTWLLDDDLLLMETKWRYQKILGHPDWQASAVEAKSFRHHLMGHQAGSQSITQDSDEYKFGDPYYDLYRPVPNE